MNSRIWRFDADELDSSKDLTAAMPPAARVATNNLPGGHLAPVCFRLSPEDVDPALAALLGMSGRGGISFGDAAAVATLADAICDEWIWPASMAKPAPACIEGTASAQSAKDDDDDGSPSS